MPSKIRGRASAAAHLLLALGPGSPTAPRLSASRPTLERFIAVDSDHPKGGNAMWQRTDFARARRGRRLGSHDALGDTTSSANIKLMQVSKATRFLKSLLVSAPATCLQPTNPLCWSSSIGTKPFQEKSRSLPLARLPGHERPQAE